MVELSCQEAQQAWRCSNEPWRTGLSWHRPGKGDPEPTLTLKPFKLHGFPPQDDAEYLRQQCTSFEEPDAQSNSLEEWVHTHTEWFDPEEDGGLACYKGYDN